MNWLPRLRDKMPELYSSPAVRPSSFQGMNFTPEP
jgi:hypothetical protein